METHFQTSFIPKKGIDTSVSGPVSSGQSQPIGLFFIIASILLGISLLIAVGVFGYQQYLKGSIDSQVAQIEVARNAIDEGEIKTMSRLSDRMKASNTLLDNHLGISNIFTVLENSTVESVRFTNFTYTYLSPEKINISMKGEGKNFASVANQAEAFKTGSTTRAYFKNSIFSDVQKSDTGIINFNFSTSIDVKSILFRLHLTDIPLNIDGLLSNGQKSDGSGGEIVNQAPQEIPVPTPTPIPAPTQAPTTQTLPNRTTGPKPAPTPTPSNPSSVDNQP